MDTETWKRSIDTGSDFPRFRVRSTDVAFRGPLFRIILLQGQNAPGHPLPRLLIDFFRAFWKAFEVWRGPNLILWAQNRSFVVELARRFVRDTTLYSFYPSHADSAAFQSIILSCEHCTATGPCALCEFNTHSIAYLWKEERPRLEILNLLKHKAPDVVISRIADFVLGRADFGFLVETVSLFRIGILHQKSAAS